MQGKTIRPEAAKRLTDAIFLPHWLPMRHPSPVEHEIRPTRKGVVVALRVALLGFAAVAAGAAVLVAWTVATLPPLEAVTGPGRVAAVLLTRDGEPFATRGPLHAAPVDASNLPALVIEPFVAIEDRRFYQHHGVDVRGTVRAAWSNLRNGGVVQGGSTITQQLVKNMLGRPEQTLGRKFQEAIAAVWLERRLSKSEILSRYLNTVYFGDGAYGLAAAARTYFDKPPEALSLTEAAMLAGLVKAPSQLAPHEHLASAQARERIVIRAMVDAGYLTPAEAASVKPAGLVEKVKLNEYGGYFADWVYSRTAPGLPMQYGSIPVRTTLDGGLQRTAESVVRSALMNAGKAGRVSQAALVAMRPDGSVAAMVGGADYTSSQFNRATQARRQPGSTFKLFVYLAAFRHGATPETLVSDEPLTIGGWTPANADRGHDGVLTVEDAFARSRNLAAIRVSEQVGRGEVIRAAHDLGVTTDLQPIASLPLGTIGVSLMEMTAAYAAVASGAYPIRPTGAPSMEASHPATQMDWDSERRPLLQVLQAAAERGTGTAAALPIPVYGKTGTTQNYRDALFIGFAGDLVVGVWVGNDDETPMNRLAGGALPAKIWRDFMETALAEQIAAAQAVRSAQEFDMPVVAPRAPSPPDWMDRMRAFFARLL
ncbi:MAG: PBP1A family penicillin-binding protein [Caulobacteraceae bacterium]